MTAEGSPADATISLLIDLAQRGEIDPWDVDVIKVIDRFFQDFNEFHLNQANLPQSGQAFLWASILVSLKADTLDALGEAEKEPVSEEDNAESEPEPHQPRKLPQKLEHHIRRRGSAPPAKKRRVTLSELITQLKDLASQIDDSSPKTQSGQSRSPSKRETAQMISHLAHNENLTELATELEQLLMQEGNQLADNGSWLSLEQLVVWWEQQKGAVSEAITTRSNRVGIFWALLLLSAQSKVELSQQEFYQDLNLHFLLGENRDN